MSNNKAEIKHSKNTLEKLHENIQIPSSTNVHVKSSVFYTDNAFLRALPMKLISRQKLLVLKKKFTSCSRNSI